MRKSRPDQAIYVPAGLRKQRASAVAIHGEPQVGTTDTEDTRTREEESAFLRESGGDGSSKPKKQYGMDVWKDSSEGFAQLLQRAAHQHEDVCADLYKIPQPQLNEDDSADSTPATMSRVTSAVDPTPAVVAPHNDDKAPDLLERLTHPWPRSFEPRKEKPPDTKSRNGAFDGTLVRVLESAIRFEQKRLSKQDPDESERRLKTYLDGFEAPSTECGSNNSPNILYTSWKEFERSTMCTKGVSEELVDKIMSDMKHKLRLDPLNSNGAGDAILTPDANGSSDAIPTDEESEQRRQYLAEHCGHVLEMYDFPLEFRTGDLHYVLRDFKSEYSLKWVHDSSALIIFGSQRTAYAVRQLKHPFAKFRLVQYGSHRATEFALSCGDALRPYKARPQTNSIVAHRLVAGALGVRTNLSTTQKQQQSELASKRRAKRGAVS